MDWSSLLIILVIDLKFDFFKTYVDNSAQAVKKKNNKRENRTTLAAIKKYGKSPDIHFICFSPPASFELPLPKTL